MEKSVTTWSSDKFADISLSIDNVAKSTSLSSDIVVRSHVFIRFRDEKVRSHEAEVMAIVKMICNTLIKFGKAAQEVPIPQILHKRY